MKVREGETIQEGVRPLRTIIEPSRRRRERNSFAPHREWEYLTGEDPPNRTEGDTVRGGEDVNGTA